jgi:hypothetical protein
MTQIFGLRQNLDKKMPRSARRWSEFIAELEVHNCFYNVSIISINSISARIIEKKPLKLTEIAKTGQMHNTFIYLVGYEYQSKG